MKPLKPSFRRTSLSAAWGAALLSGLLLSACSKPTPESLMTAAQRHLAENDPRAAQIELRNAVQLAPNSGPAHRLLGATLLRTGDPVAAEIVLRKALSFGEKADEVVPDLARSLLRLGQPQKVIDEFAATTLADPAANASLRDSVGQARLMRGEVEEAAAAFAAALAAQPGLATAQLGQARIAAHHGRLDEALALTDGALKADAHLVDSLAFRSQLQLAKGQRAPAIESLEQALAIDAGYLPARLALASLQIDGRDYDKAKSLLGATGVPAKDPRVLYLQGLIALRQNDLPKAKDALSAVLQQAPEHRPSLLLAGEIELRTGNLSMAEQHLGKAARGPLSSAVQRLLATTYLRQNRPGKAIDTLQPLLQDAAARDAGLSLLAGEAYLANGDVRRAAEFFEASKAAPANEAAARTRLGQIAVTRGDFERGAQELQAASSLSTSQVEPDLLLVTLHLRRQDAAKALAAAQAFIKKQPQNPMGPVLAGMAQLAKADRAAARQSFEAALKIKPDHVPALRGLAELDVVEKRPAEAQRRYDALLDKKPDDEQLLVALGELQEHTGRLDDAGKTLRKAVAASPRSPAPAVALVQYHLRRKDAKAAMEVAQEAVSNNPDQLRLVELLSMTQEAAGAGRDALRTLTALVLKEPHAVGPLIRLAQIQARQRDFDGAASTLVRAQEKAPDNDGVTRELIGAYLQGGKIEPALKVARDLQARRPKDAIGHALEGDVRVFTKKWPEAERAYRAALKVDPRAGLVAAKVYRVLNVTGRKKDAADFAADWTARHPADMSMRLIVAEAALGARDYPLAAQQYEAALAVDPNNAMALNNLAWALGELKDPKAIGFAERAVALAPNSPSVLDTLGMLHLRAGDAKKAMESLERMRQLAPDRLDLRLHYAMGLLQSGRTQEGQAELRELAATKVDFPGKAGIPALLAKQ